MKRKNYLVVLLCVVCTFEAHAQTWDEWFKQRKTQRKYMLQQIAKLQVYLGYVKQGYKIVRSGMNVINNIKAGDINLHALFFDHLKQVSPAVSNYQKSADIFHVYFKMTDVCKSSFKEFSTAGTLTASEIDFLYKLFTKILDKATEDKDQLVDVLTAGRLKMSDAERLKRIDELHKCVSDKYTSLFSLKGKIQLLLWQRQRELKDLETLQNLYAP